MIQYMNLLWVTGLNRLDIQVPLDLLREDIHLCHPDIPVPTVGPQAQPTAL
jgi:hypothetical protein